MPNNNNTHLFPDLELDIGHLKGCHGVVWSSCRMIMMGRHGFCAVTIRTQSSSNDQFFTSDSSTGICYSCKRLRGLLLVLQICLHVVFGPPYDCLAAAALADLRCLGVKQAGQKLWEVMRSTSARPHAWQTDSADVSFIGFVGLCLCACHKALTEALVHDIAHLESMFFCPSWDMRGLCHISEVRNSGLQNALSGCVFVSMCMCLSFCVCVPGKQSVQACSSQALTEALVHDIVHLESMFFCP